MHASRIRKPDAAKKSTTQAALASAVRASSAELPAAAHVKLLHCELPVAQRPLHSRVLGGKSGRVRHAAAETGHIATACASDKGLNFFALSGGASPLRTSRQSNKFPEYSRALSGLGRGFFASSAEGGLVSTWRASTGKRLETVQILSNDDEGMAIAALGVKGFVVGTLAVHGDRVVTASGDRTAAVWSATTHERIAVLRDYKRAVFCADITDRFLATGSADGKIRMYENFGSFPLIRVLEGLHSSSVCHVSLLNGTTLMSASGPSLYFTSLPNGRPLARVDFGFPVLSAAVLPDGRLACVGWEMKAVVFSPPAEVSEALKKPAAALFPPTPPSALNGNEPLQAAVVDVTGGPGLPSVSGAVNDVDSGCVEKDGMASGPSSDGITPASGGGGAASIAPPADVILAGSDFDLMALKATASNVKDVISLTGEQLSRTVAAVMTNFDEDSRPRLPVLAGCLRAVFKNASISGDTFVGLPEILLRKVILDSLAEDGVYRSFGDASNRSFEWRLQCFLLHLREPVPAGRI